MKFIHTADWHLGRILFGVHLTDDQSHLLDQFVTLVRDTRPAAVVVAGDIYDRAVPPIEAVQLLNRVLSTIVDDLGVPTVVIAGNHDSAERLAFGASLLREKGLFICGPVTGEPEVLLLEDGDGPVAFCPIPYADPSIVRERLGDSGIVDHETALAALLARARASIPDGCRSVAVAHAFVTGGEESQSERPLVIGGSGRVDAAIFEGFDYAALGHLHRPQSAGGERIRYSGSLLKYSFSEAEHTKSVNLVTIDGEGGLSVEGRSLAPRRDLRRVTGLLDEIIAGATDDPSPEDYLMAVLEDRGPRFDVMGKLREVYPNVMNVSRGDLPDGDEAGILVSAERLERSPEDLFDAFFGEVTGDALSDDERKELRAVLEALRLGEEGTG